MSTHAERAEVVAAQLRGSAVDGVRLRKSSSNLFRDRRAAGGAVLDVCSLDAVLSVDRAAGVIEAEGMVPYDALVEATLAHGLMPAVVPQLKSITLGGAAAGVGIEATSFRHGLVHHTLLEIEVLTGTGEIVTATPENAHRDLFFGFPNSYGTLGYALRLRAKASPVRPFVEVRHRRYGTAAACFAELAQLADTEVDFLDGVVFSEDTLVLSTGRFVDSAPWTSAYDFKRIYYRSLLERETDYLPTASYLWRWDTDWFWCSKNLGAQNPLVRRLLGRGRLNSRFYMKAMRWNSRLGLTRGLDKFSGWHRESVIQDVDIPIAHAGRFLAFLHERIGILPIWLCPLRVRSDGRFPLYPLEPGALYVNFGFWDVVRSRVRHPEGWFNRLIEREVIDCGGIKSLYSDCYHDEAQFWGCYGGDDYRTLKRRYDPQGRFPDLYRKCVLRH